VHHSKNLCHPEVVVSKVIGQSSKFFSPKNQKICVFRPISQQPFIVDSSGKKRKYGPCPGLPTVKTASVYHKRGIFEKIFFTCGVKMAKKSLLCQKIRRRFIFRGN